MGAEYNGDEDAARRRAERADLEVRLRAGPPLLLDGGTGTELERLGLRCDLPLWSARALIDDPSCVARVHAAYRDAGAEILTANTFRTQRRTLARAGVAPQDSELCRLAVQLARDAAGSGPGAAWVAGSAPTLEDCYRPDRVPAGRALDREHRAHAENLAAAGADLILVETMNTIREARAAAGAAAATGLPFFVSFVSWRGARLLSGESLARALAAVAGAGPLALLVNCLPPSAVGACLPALRACGLPFGVYANLGAPDAAAGSSRSEACTPTELARQAGDWLRGGAAVIGGCCGTTPGHIRGLAKILRTRVVPPIHRCL